MPITKRDVETAEPNTIIWDQGRGSVPGFGMRRQRSIPTFIFKYTNLGRSRWYTIGGFGSPWTVEQARGEAKRLLGVVAAGGDPGADRKAAKSSPATALQQDLSPFSIRDLCEQYYAAATAGLVLTRFKRPKKPATLAFDRGRIDRHINPLIGNLPVAEVDRHVVRRMITDISAGKTAVDEKTKLRGRAIVTGGHTTAARVADLLSGIMAWAVDENLLQTNPVHGVRRFRGDPRERFLNDEELGRLGAVLTREKALPSGAFHPYALAIIELLGLTGCRLGEIASLKWSEVDRQDRCLRLADSKTGKSMRALGDTAFALLNGLERLAGSPHVFPASRGEGAYQGTKRQAGKIFAAAGIEGVSSHTLRHTFGSVASGLGYSDATIAGLLGHAGRGVTSRYVHRPDEALRLAANDVCARIQALMFEG